MRRLRPTPTFHQEAQVTVWLTRMTSPVRTTTPREPHASTHTSPNDKFNTELYSSIADLNHRLFDFDSWGNCYDNKFSFDCDDYNSLHCWFSFDRFLTLLLRFESWIVGCEWWRLLKRILCWTKTKIRMKYKRFWTGMSPKKLWNGEFIFYDNTHLNILNKF